MEKLTIEIAGLMVAILYVCIVLDLVALGFFFVAAAMRTH